MKKLFAVLMALSLVLAMGTIAFAAGDGKITINKAMDKAVYEVYKMLDFVPSNEAGDKGIYTIVAGWEDFFAAEPATNYFTVTTNADQTTVALKEGVTEVDQTLAKAAIKYAEDKNIDATKTATANGEIVEFTGLDLGYYAIDTSLGTLCALTNTNSTFTATEKNAKPDIDKEVQEDADSSWGKVNDADINQVVNYKSTVTVGLGATNYVMHDTMEAGLTFNTDSVVVTVDGTELDAYVDEDTEYDYKVIVDPADDCTFDIEFNNAYIETLAKGKEIVVTYSATLNENAKVATDGNDNTVYLSYGESSTWETTPHTTTTYTWKMDVLKYTLDGTRKVELAGAVFQLLKTKDAEDSAISFVKVTTVNSVAVTVPTYRVAVTGDKAEDIVNEITTDENGKFEIVGLDEGTYYLHEKTAPEGYNKLAEDLTVTITSEHKDAELTATYKINGETPATIAVENKTGGLLPETGGIGTTIFYVVGGLLMVAALIVLVSKKRMSSFA